MSTHTVKGNMRNSVRISLDLTEEDQHEEKLSTLQTPTSTLPNTTVKMTTRVVAAIVTNNAPTADNTTMNAAPTTMMSDIRACITAETFARQLRLVSEACTDLA